MENWHYNKEIGVESSKTLGNTNTNHRISEFVIKNSVFKDSITKETRFLEPAVGAGSFYFAILDRLLIFGFDLTYIIENMIYACDIDDNSLNILKSKLKNSYGYSSDKFKIYCNDFLLNSDSFIKFDFIITNPPYVSSKNISSPLYSSKQEYVNAIKSINKIDFENNADIFIPFFLKTFKLLKDDGQHIFICSDGWIDSKYGKIISDKIINKEVYLNSIESSHLFPFFRDDTSAIITKFTKHFSDTRLISLGLDYKELAIKNISNREIINLFESGADLNKRNILVIFQDKYYAFKKNIEKYEKSFTQLNKLIDVESTQLSCSQILRDEMLIENNNENILFWQIQARVNKKPNYKLKIEKKELPYSVHINNASSKVLLLRKECSTYISSIIDRFPLCFYAEFPTYHISKYYYLFSKKLSQIEICLSMNNIFTIFNMELELKEGTRKTLRVGEMGVVKELKREDLKKLMIIDMTKFSKESRSKINQLSKALESEIIYNIEEALKNKNYYSIQKIIQHEIDMNDVDFNKIVEDLLFLYYFRMRNIKKLEKYIDFQ